ncbi:MAG: replication initiator protein [Microvirus sp.]|nr:MAG: replication initiator protein [Microvirus sp.]
MVTGSKARSVPCFRPLKAVKVPGGVSFDSRVDGPEIDLPCGRCQGCRLEHSRQWAVRCVHESRLHPYNSVVTLTYSDSYLPPGGSLVYKDFQDFMKRLRSWYRRSSNSRARVRFFMCGEYGDVKKRPHFHAALFGFDFLDKKLWKKTDSGSTQFRSKRLESLWPFGLASVGDPTFDSFAYIARYAMQKINGDIVHVRDADRIDLRTGEILPLVPEFIHMSLKPGIGRGWIDRFVDDVYSFDRVVMNGFESKPPRYYDKIIQARHPFAWREISRDREDRALLYPEESTRRRLEAREAVTLARLRSLRRDLE